MTFGSIEIDFIACEKLYVSFWINEAPDEVPEPWPFLVDILAMIDVVYAQLCGYVIMFSLSCGDNIA